MTGKYRKHINFLKPCKCGCGELIWNKDKYSHIMQYKPAHSNIGRKFGSEKYIGEKARNWKGGIAKGPKGYVWKRCEGHPRATKWYHVSYVFEHILVMEKHLGRYLKPNELVHHINGIKTDNRIENLQVMTKSEHMSYHQTERLKRRKAALTQTIDVFF